MSDEIKTGVEPVKKDKGVPGKYLVRLIVVLAAVCVVIAGLLATVNAVTKDKIDAHRKEARDAAIREVFPDADKNELYEAEGLDAEVYLVYRDGAIAGYAARVLPSGFGGEIEMMVGVDVNGKTTGVSIISMSETPGVGSKTNSPDFLKRYCGKGGDVRIGDGENDIQGISGATISSKAVTEGVRIAHGLGIDLETIAKELGVPVWHGSENQPADVETEPVPESGPEPVDRESETETEPAPETEPEETFVENGNADGGIIPVEVEETDDRYQVEIGREEYEEKRAETDPETESAQTTVAVTSSQPTDNPGGNGNSGENPGGNGNTGENPEESGNTGENPEESGNTGENPEEGGNTGENPEEGGNTGENPGDNDDPGGNGDSDNPAAGGN